MSDHGWLTAQTPRPRAAPPPSLGQDAYTATGRDRKLPLPIPGIERSRHALCIDHVEVADLIKPLCITRGQDRAAVIAEARELAGGG